MEEMNINATCGYQKYAPYMIDLDIDTRLNFLLTSIAPRIFKQFSRSNIRKNPI